MQRGAERVLHLRRGRRHLRPRARVRLYGEKLCFMELQEPTDAYEWSFVAVPAQRRAGVVKRFGPEGTRGRHAAHARRSWVSGI